MSSPKRKSKIVCTMGPSVAGLERTLALIEAGMDVARLNFSHGSHETHAETIRTLREASQRANRPIAILADLQGPKIRTSKILDALEGGLPLQLRARIWFRGFEKTELMVPGRGTRSEPIGISYLRLAQDLAVDDLVLFDDGLVRMRVASVWASEGLVELEVEHGKTLGENKGVNMPGARLSTLGVTEKDWNDVLFGIEQNVDFFALSFVRSAREVKNLKQFLNSRSTQTQVIAKIEMADGVSNIDEILVAADGIMVARGDLGVEIGNEKVPMVQKRLIAKARACGKPVITATQMLMSMVQSPSPSRAEASDVANAVLDGSDALMLSNETATGQYPLEAVKTMASIIVGAESMADKHAGVASLLDMLQDGHKLPISEAIEAAATSLASSLSAHCLSCLTRSGQAARQLAKYRPGVPIYAFAENEKVQRQLALTWGVSVVPWKEMAEKDYTVFDELLRELGRLGFVQPDELAVMTAGIPTSLQVGTTNTVVVRRFDRARHGAIHG